MIDTANQLGAENVHLIYGHGGELMRERLANESVNWVFQAEQLGTGHAMQQAMPFFRDDENVYGVWRWSNDYTRNIAKINRCET